MASSLSHLTALGRPDLRPRPDHAIGCKVHAGAVGQGGPGGSDADADEARLRRDGAAARRCSQLPVTAPVRPELVPELVPVLEPEPGLEVEPAARRRRS